MAKPLSKTVVVAYGRSAVAKSGKKGALRNLHPIDMGGLVLKGVMEKIPQLDPALVEDVILGCAIPEAKQGLNPARLVAAGPGLPYTACGLTVDRFCSSSLQAVALAAWQIEAGQADCIVAGGIESMTALPMTLDRSGDMDPWLLEHDPAQYISNGETAENVAEKYNVTREEMDRLALESHRKAAAAQDAGYFDEQIIPLPGADAEGNEIVFHKDQGIRRDTTLEKMASMKPCFPGERPGHRRHLLPDQRRRGFPGADEPGQGRRDGHPALGLFPGLLCGRPGPGLHGPGPHLRRAQGAGVHRPDHGRHGRD